MAKTVKAKRMGAGLEIKTFEGTQGTYLVMKLPSGAFHAFVETEAKQAAKDCGAKVRGYPNTREYWKSLWNR